MHRGAATKESVIQLLPSLAPSLALSPSLLLLSVASFNAAQHWPRALRMRGTVITLHSRAAAPRSKCKPGIFPRHFISFSLPPRRVCGTVIVTIFIRTVKTIMKRLAADLACALFLRGGGSGQTHEGWRCFTAVMWSHINVRKRRSVSFFRLRLHPQAFGARRRTA